MKTAGKQWFQDVTVFNEFQAHNTVMELKSVSFTVEKYFSL